MASIISSGTTSGTALNMSGDTSGVLQLATNGTTTALTLDASQNATFAGTLTTTGITNSGVATGARFNPTGSSVTGNGMYLPAANSLGLSTNGTNAVYIDSSQNVGIGTSSPTHPLTVSGASGIIRVNSTGGTTTSNIGFTNTGGSFYLGLDSSTGGNFGAGNYGAFLYNGANSPMVFFTNGTERMRIDSSGNLLVGATNLSFGERLSVRSVGTSSASDGIYVCNSAGTTIFRVRSDGAFQTGAAAVSPYNNTTGSAANTFVNTDGTLLRSTSSLKYKKDIADATHGLTDLLKLRSVTYKGKNEADGEKTFGGLIAEEVHDAGLTEFVHYSTDGTPDALNYGNMVSLCVKAIQELKAINDTQAETINALTARIVALESRT